MIDSKNRGLVIATALSLVAAGSAAAWAAGQARGPVNAASVSAAAAPPSFAELFQKVSPAVVSIDVTGHANPSDVVLGGEDQNWGGEGGQPLPFPFPFDFENGQGGTPRFQFHRYGGALPDGRDLPKVQGSGSGFFISADGYIVTNNHVVEHADTITVRTTDRRVLKARLVGRDPATDLAVVKVEGGGYPFVTFEDAAKPRVGDWVVAIGNPFGLGGTATAGIVSALGRENVTETRLVDYMQIDAPINRGNSGGPTFDVYGRVVGVNTAIYSPSGGSVGIGFDIPADVAASITHQIIANGRVSHGYIGATIQGITPEMSASLGLRTTDGAIVAGLKDGGPAERSGLHIGDVVLAVNGKSVTSASDLTHQVAFSKPGDTLRLTVLRDEQRQDVVLRAGVRPSEEQLALGDSGADDLGPLEGSASGHRVLGMSLAQLDRAQRERYDLPDGARGVVVESVGRNSDAAEKGLKPGDIITKAGVRSVTQPSDVAAAVADAKREGRKAVLLLVRRQGQTVFVPVEVGKALG